MRRCLLPSLFTFGLVLACDFTDIAIPGYPEALSERVDWLKNNAATLVHATPGSADFADLMPLGTAIGDARIVLLGEQSHGDGTVFLTKARLIEFLHSQLGFDVLAFESGLYDVDLAWRRIAAGEPAATAVRSAVFSIWTGSSEFQSTIEYIERAARSAHPLELAGFDLQFTGRASRDSLVTELDALLRRNGSNLPGDHGWEEFRSLLQGLAAGTWYTALPPEQERARFSAMLIESIELVNTSSGFTYDGVVTMGEVATESLGNELYMLGFTAYAGSAGRWSIAPYPLSVALIPSLEWMFNEAGFQNAFLDLRRPAAGGEWLQGSIISRPLGYVDMRGVWPRHLDGIIYHREMAPSTKWP